jgi:hypothetical protein
MFKRSLICLMFALCIGSVAKAQTHQAALTWTLSADDTTTACAVTGANCSQAVYRGPGACSASTVLTALNSSLSATVTSYTDTTITPGTYCYAVTFTIGGQTSVIYKSGDTNFSTVLLPPSPQTGLAAVAQ